MRKFIFFTLPLILTTHLFSQSLQLEVDTTYADEGYLTTVSSATSINSFPRMNLQSDGKAIVAGDVYSQSNSTNDIFLTRYLENGVIDSTFGNAGLVVLETDIISEKLMEISIQNDGKILAIAYSTESDTANSFLYRFESNGDIDSTFGVSGCVKDPFLDQSTQYFSIALNNDGKIFVAGKQSEAFDRKCLIICYDQNGDLDSTFSSDGILLNSYPFSFDKEYEKIRIQNDGKIVVAGFLSNGSEDKFLIARYNTDGSVDNSFSDDGYISDVVNGIEYHFIEDIEFQSDGKLIASIDCANNHDYDVVLTRFNTDGTYDLTFSIDTFVITSVGTGLDGVQVSDLIVLSDDKIMSFGYSHYSNSNPLEPPVFYYNIMKFGSNGVLEQTYDSDGMEEVCFANSNFCSGNVGAIQDDGKILIVGFYYDSVAIQGRIGVVRFIETLGYDGISEYNQPSFLISPNPFSKVAQVILPKTVLEGQFQITSTNGNIIKEKTSFEGGSFELNCNDLIPGIYFLQIESNGYTGVERFIIE